MILIYRYDFHRIIMILLKSLGFLCNLHNVNGIGMNFMESFFLIASTGFVRNHQDFTGINNNFVESI